MCLELLLTNLLSLICNDVECLNDRSYFQNLVFIRILTINGHKLTK